MVPGKRLGRNRKAARVAVGNFSRGAVPDPLACLIPLITDGVELAL